MQWTRWCDHIKLDLSWNNLLAMSPPLLSFYLGATYDTLPSPSNLYRWHIVPEAVFPLLLTSLHISLHSWSMRVCITTRKIYFLSWCNIGSSIINYKKFLNIVPCFKTLKRFLTLYHVSKTNFSSMRFVKACARLPKTSNNTNVHWQSAPDWVLWSDVHQ